MQFNLSSVGHLCDLAPKINYTASSTSIRRLKMSESMVKNRVNLKVKAKVTFLFEEITKLSCYSKLLIGWKVSKTGGIADWESVQSNTLLSWYHTNNVIPPSVIINLQS